MIQLIPTEVPKVRPAVLDYIRQFAHQFRPVVPVKGELAHSPSA